MKTRMCKGLVWIWLLFYSVFERNTELTSKAWKLNYVCFDVVRVESIVLQGVWPTSDFNKSMTVWRSGLSVEKEYAKSLQIQQIGL